MKYILSIFFLLTLSTCKRGNGNDILANPPKDYFKCKVNGQSYIAGCDEPFNNCVSLRFTSQGNGLLITGNSRSNSMGIFLYDSTGIKAGNHIVNNIYGSANNANYRNYNISTQEFFSTDSTNTGVININFDHAKSRVSGVFAFKAKFETSDDTVEVTDGEFSLPVD